MTTYVITISETFPKTHKRAGQETDFLTSIKNGDKIHTIRGNKNGTSYTRWVKRFEKINAGKAVLVLKVWEGKPYGKDSTQKEVFRFDKSHGIGVERLEFFENQFDIPCINYPLINNYEEPTIETIAKNDGLSLVDFKEWFKTYDLTQEMAIIHFTAFRYAKNSK